jgi:hypothetical protein
LLAAPLSMDAWRAMVTRREGFDDADPAGMRVEESSTHWAVPPRADLPA